MILAAPNYRRVAEPSKDGDLWVVGGISLKVTIFSSLCSLLWMTYFAGTCKAAMILYHWLQSNRVSQSWTNLQNSDLK